MIHNTKIPEETNGYKITDRIQADGNDYVIGHKPDHPIAPFVVWSVDYNERGFSHGYYCSTKEEALLNLFERASRGIDFPEEKSLAMHLLDDYDRAALYEEFRDADLKEDILANLEDYLDNEDLLDVSLDRFKNDKAFMDAAMHNVFYRDHSDDNEMIRQILEDLIEEKFQHLLPEIYADAVKVEDSLIPKSDAPFELIFSKEAFDYLDAVIKGTDNSLPADGTIFIYSEHENKDSKGLKKEYAAMLDYYQYDTPGAAHFRLQFMDVTNPDKKQAIGSPYDLIVGSMPELIFKVNNLPLKQEWNVNLKVDKTLDRLNNWYVLKSGEHPNIKSNMGLVPFFHKGTPVKVIAKEDHEKYGCDGLSGMPLLHVKTKEGKEAEIPEHYLSSQNINHLMEKQPLDQAIKNANQKRETQMQDTKENSLPELGP